MLPTCRPKECMAADATKSIWIGMFNPDVSLTLWVFTQGIDIFRRSGFQKAGVLPALFAVRMNGPG